MVFIFLISIIKSYSSFLFPMLNQNFVYNVNFFITE
jgi:hypothetical protein